MNINQRRTSNHGDDGGETGEQKGYGAGSIGWMTKMTLALSSSSSSSSLMTMTSSTDDPGV